MRVAPARKRGNREVRSTVRFPSSGRLHRIPDVSLLPPLSAGLGAPS